MSLKIWNHGDLEATNDSQEISKQTAGALGVNGRNVHPVRQLIRDRLIKECGPQQLEIRGFAWKEAENHDIIILHDLKNVRQLPLNILKVSQTFHSEVISRYF